MWTLLLLVAADWPDREVRLTPLAPALPEQFENRTVFLDAGHGAPGNDGNLSAACVYEREFTLRLAKDLESRLRRTGLFRVVLSRSDEERPSYADRFRAAETARADVVLSLHSDNRVPTGWEPSPMQPCPRLDQAPGFTVLWSDEGELAPGRLLLARSLAQSLSLTGFPAYRGDDYHGMYEEDAEVPGVMVDRHSPDQRIAFLRRPSVPSVIIETHHSWVLAEAQRWEEPATLLAFGDAVTAALLDYFSALPEARR